jgi:hypothetical protein
MSFKTIPGKGWPSVLRIQIFKGWLAKDGNEGNRLI